MEPDLSLLNREQLLNRCLDSVEFTLQMLKVFRDSAPGVADSLKTAARAGTLPEVRRHAHTLKGSAANMAIEPLRALAFEIEKLAEQQAQTQVTEKLPALDQLLERSLAAAMAFERDLAGA